MDELEVRNPATITPHPEGWLYFIQQGSDGPVKVGRAGDPLTRLDTLQVGNPEVLRIICASPAAASLERAIHHLLDLRDARIGDSEWFQASVVYELLRRLGATDHMFELLAAA